MIDGNFGEILPWHSEAAARLGHSRAAGLLPHALLFHGPEGIGKKSFARAFAASLLCDEPSPEGQACRRCRSCRAFAAGSHPDWYVVGGDDSDGKKTIGIDGVRELCGHLMLSPSFSSRRLAMIAPAEAMTIQGESALLKTLEEPPAGVHIFFVASRLGFVLSTVRSRCQLVFLASPSGPEALVWLHKHGGGDCLELADGAPLKARELAQQGAVELRKAAFGEWHRLMTGQSTAAALAKDWSEHSRELLFALLLSWTRDLARLAVGGEKVEIDNGEFRTQLLELARSCRRPALFAACDRLRQLATSAVQERVLWEELLESFNGLAKTSL